LFEGTIALSNIGTIGGTYTGPLILPPQICIVGIGKVMVVPKYDEQMNLVPRKIVFYWKKFYNCRWT
jgi:2-oxoisovalerate dehydrogenase E2 component (dihydrolipoyl transacylase)